MRDGWITPLESTGVPLGGTETGGPALTVGTNEGPPLPDTWAGIVLDSNCKLYVGSGWIPEEYDSNMGAPLVLAALLDTPGDKDDNTTLAEVT